MLMFTTIICLTIGIIAKYKIDEFFKRIKELEERLYKSYKEREQILKQNK